jgi:hypothetical protein
MSSTAQGDSDVSMHGMLFEPQHCHFSRCTGLQLQMTPLGAADTYFIQVGVSPPPETTKYLGLRCTVKVKFIDGTAETRDAYRCRCASSPCRFDFELDVHKIPIKVHVTASQELSYRGFTGYYEDLSELQFDVPSASACRSEVLEQQTAGLDLPLFTLHDSQYHVVDVPEKFNIWDD